MHRFVLAVDQGTTSTRAIVLDRAGRIVATDQREHRQHYPQPGWVEHDPLEIWQRTREVIQSALAAAQVDGTAIAAVGIANQRETIVAWNRRTGQPYAPAIVWQDTRTAELCARLERAGYGQLVRERTGLPISTYFSGPKIRWLLDHHEAFRADAERGEALVGTVDSWLIWWLTGGPAGGVHVTDVTNASRTMLMDLRRLDWDDDLLALLGIPRQLLPRILPSATPELYGVTDRAGPLGAAVPIGAALGDQQAALVGQACFAPGMAKNTYGTGCFLLLHTGHELVRSRFGLLTTVAYQLADRPCAYALEGSIAMAGALVQWFRDNLGLVREAAEIEELARTVEDSGGVYVVPFFTGAFAPYWRPEARGAIVGLTRYVHRGHLARAALEAVAYQTRDVVEAMVADSGMPLTVLRVDGGMVRNAFLMQLQADILGVPVVAPAVTETTALGAAYAAGLAVGFWSDLAELVDNWREAQRWEPSMSAEERERRYAEWQRVVARTLA